MGSIVVGTSPQSLSAGADVSSSVSKRGELLSMPWHVQLALEGKVYTCGVGSITTGVTTDLNLVIDVTQPAFMLRVPQDVTVIPLFMHAYYEATGAAIAEGVASLTDSDPGNGTSSALTRTPVNMLARGPISACTGRQVVTVTPTYVNTREFWRFGEPADLDATSCGTNGFRWSYLTNANVPIAVGPATVNLEMACGTSSTVFITVVYAEFRTAELA